MVLTRAQKERLRRERAVTMDTVRARVYPTDGVGASLVGFCRHERDTTYATGLEYALQDLLAGRPGRCRSVDTGIPGRDLGRVVVDEPEHGRSVVLTIDEDLQAIAERRLAEAVAETRADGGLGADRPAADRRRAGRRQLAPDAHAPRAPRRRRRLEQPQLHLACTSRVRSSRSSPRPRCCGGRPWTRPPSSTAPTTEFNGFVIRNDDDHKYGDLSLMQAFTKSANVWFARAVANLGRDEFYRDILDFGFGQPTLAPYGGQPAGILREPADWSGRSQATLAIGQEIAVTPLQLGMAVAAVANGGTLYAPRLIREVHDHDGRLLEERPPLALRRVMRRAPGRGAARGHGPRGGARARAPGTRWTGSASAARPAPPRRVATAAPWPAAPTWPPSPASRRWRTRGW